MKKRLPLLAFLLALAMIVSACSGNATEEPATPDNNAQGSNQPATITVKHQLDETEVKVNPQRVVVFDFGILDSLDKLGIEVAGVPKASLPAYLEKYSDDKYANIGSLKEPDFEKLAAIGPELIIISGRQADLYDQLSEIAPTIYLGVDTTNYMESFKSNMQILGQVFDKSAQIEEELARIDTAVNELKEKAANLDGKALIILTTGGKLSAYGPGSRFGLIHDEFGVPAVDEGIEASTHGMSISFEYIAQKNPDYLFVIDRDSATDSGETARQLLDNELVRGTKAYQNDNIIYLNPELWYLSGGGLTSVAEMVKELSQALSK